MLPHPDCARGLRARSKSALRALAIAPALWIGCARGPAITTTFARVEAPAQTPDEPPATTVTLSGNDPRIQWLGRAERGATSTRFSWAASGFLLRYVGRGVRARLAEVQHLPGARESDSLSVELDGEVRTLPLRADTTSYELVSESAPRGPHVLRVRKRTEPRAGTVTLVSLELEPGTELDDAAAPRAEVVELIGDSVTTGYGNLCASPSDSGTMSDEDATETWGVLGAEAIGLEPSVLAWSGKGLIRNQAQSSSETMPALWHFTLPMEREGSLTSGASSAQQVRAVIINLGGNDFLGVEPPSVPPASEFAAGLDVLHGDVRAARPTALIALAVGPMIVDDHPRGTRFRTTLLAWSRAAVARWSAAGDAHVALLDLGLQDARDGFGCAYHPSVATHRRLGEAFARWLEGELGQTVGALPIR